MTKILLFLKLQLKATKLESSSGSRNEWFSRKHCCVPNETASVQHIPRQTFILLGHLKFIKKKKIVSSLKKLNKVYYSEQLPLSLDSLLH